MVELIIERLAKTGEGVGKHDGRAVFVEGALPGEKVRGELTQVGAAWRIDGAEIVVPSKARRTPPCPLADRCGGCDWQHADEQTQRAGREEIVLSALEHLGGFKRDSFQVLPTVTSAPFGTRRRATLHPVGGALGFYGRRSHDAVVIDRCPALVPALERFPAQVAEAMSGLLKDCDDVQVLEAGGKLAIAVQLKGPIKPKHLERAAKWKWGTVWIAKDGAKEIVGTVELKDGPVLLRPDGFAQANAHVNQQLVQAAVAGLQGGQHALELYSGNGNFTVELAKGFAQVTAIESSPVGVALALKRKPANVRVLQGDAEKMTLSLLAEGHTFDRLLVDPPRTGAPGVGRWAARAGASRVVYVACDPASLARDSAELFANGYRPETLQLFELFPQTRHVEAVMVLSRA